jgi:hypothetical protein
MEYLEFLEKKKHTIGNFGFEPNYIPDIAFDFQKYIIEKAIKKGRIAIFADTGLGKTLIQLSIAKNIIQETNKKVLILTPLAVAFQFILEAENLGIDDIEYSKDGKHTKKIVICNYERLHYFNSSDFVGVILDESSILKNFDGKIKQEVTAFVKKIPYRFLSTATPSPNDFIELGTSSEALGYMGYMDMLGKFFKNNQNDTGGHNNIGEKFYLKPHAEKDFFAWVNQWAIMVKMPSDLGFSNERYNLPELIVNRHIVKNQSMFDVNGQVSIFVPIAKSMTEVRHEQNQTEEKRCQKAAELVDPNNISFIWCNTNTEGDLLQDLIPNSINVSGSDSIEKKEEAVLWFLGKKCICDSKNFSNFVLNWQNNKLCGNQNTQRTDEKNINSLSKKEKEERIKVDLLMKTKSICLNIIKITLQNSNSTTTERKRKIEEEESVMQMIRSIEKKLNEKVNRDTEVIQTQDLRGLLNNMVLLSNNIKKYLKNKMVDVGYVNQKVQMMEKEIDYLLTIATQKDTLEDCFVQSVTSESGISTMMKIYSKEPLCTCGHKSGVRRIISKAKIFGMGLNFQHCNHSVFFPTWSYEQYYQAIRRFWRFGQKNDVTIDMVISDGQTRVLEAIEQKTQKAIQLHKNLTENVNRSFENKVKEFNKQIIKPKFL